MKLKASQIMSSNPITVKFSDDLNLAHQMMKQSGVRHLPVIDESENIIGILSDRNFQRAMWPLQKVSEKRLGTKAVFKPDATVSEYMSWPVKTLPEDTELATVVKAMIDEKISAVLITRQQELAGIVTHEDLLIVLSAFLKKPTSIKEQIVEWTYRSPIGRVISFLADAGV